MSLDRVEDLLRGLPECLAILCDLLVIKNKRMEAKGIFERNKLQVEDFNFKGNQNRRGIANDLKNMNYDPSRDFHP